MSPSQRDLAKALGVSAMTVSLALRNSPRISEATRLRVRATAGKMGYHPDPALSALNNWRRRRMIQDQHTTLAFVTDWRTRDHWRKNYVHEFFVGAREAAARRGYRLEPFWLGEYPDLKRASDVLHARGIRGLLIAPFPEETTRLELKWNRFAAVAVGPGGTHPPLHRAVHDYAAGMRDVMGKLISAGYRKIALGIPERLDEITEHGMSDTFLAAIQRHPRLRGSQLAGRGEESAKAAHEWLSGNRPEVLITIGRMFPEALKIHGWKVPEEIAHVSMRLDSPGDGRTAGISHASHEIGSIAVAKLDSLLQANELGLPEHPLNLAVRGRWCDGASCPLGQPLGGK